jgi:hypothetical protein
MEVDAQRRPEPGNCLNLRGKDLLYIRIAFEYRRKPRFDTHCDSEVRPAALQNLERRCGEDTITQRPQSNDGHPRSVR